MSLLTVTYLESALTDPRLIILGLCTFLLCLANAVSDIPLLAMASCYDIVIDMPC